MSSNDNSSTVSPTKSESPPGEPPKDNISTETEAEPEAEKCVDENEVGPQRYNPSISDELKDEELEKMKGDAIGDTLYSERFVLSTLMKLSKVDKDLSDDDAFEKDLCNLWDMTIEKDVVKLLLEHKVLELFAGVIDETEDKRLTEILVGIMGNMCNVAEARDVICHSPEIMLPIVDLISCSDSLTLIQLMRFFHTSLVFENNENEIVWFQHFRQADSFVEHFSFILKNSINNTLLFNSMEALNAICGKFAAIEEPGFPEMFVKPALIEAVLEAFKTLQPKNKDLNESKDETSTPTQNAQKIMSVFLDIHVTLSQYDDLSRSCYQPHTERLMRCISQILSPLCKPIFLLPLTFNEQEVIENLNELFQAIGDPFDDICFSQMITIWNLLDSDCKSKDAAQSSSWEDDETVDEVNTEDLGMTILEFLTRTVRNAPEEKLQNALKKHSAAVVKNLLGALSAGDSEDDIKECCTKIREAFKKTQQSVEGN